MQLFSFFGINEAEKANIEQRNCHEEATPARRFRVVMIGCEEGLVGRSWFQYAPKRGINRQTWRKFFKECFQGFAEIG